MRIKVRVGANETEIEAPPGRLREIIGLLPDVVKSLPAPSSPSPPVMTINEGTIAPQRQPQIPRADLPQIKIERDNSLSDIIMKLFAQPWGRQPRRLSNVREALESYGMVYPKQSVAVALLRLAQSGKLRRFKGEGGEFVYTASIAISGGGEGPANPEVLVG